jgi:hypothetical protein
MKSRYSGKKIILLLAIFYSLTFSQQWNDLKQTTIPFNSGTVSKIDMFSNKDGNHILVRYYQYPPGTHQF